MLTYMQNAKAFVFAAEEDFGITPVEAQSCGTPVIAFGKGGGLETVRPYGVNNPTGIFFSQQSISSVIKAVQEFEVIADKIEPIDCRNNSLLFSSSIFRQKMASYVENRWNEFNATKTMQY